MKTLQKVFVQSYVDEIRDALSSDAEREKYLLDEYPYDDSKVRVLAGVVHPEGLEDKMLAAESEFEAAKLLFEAYSDIKPLIASSDTFWSYLSHVDLFRYCKKRWPIENADVKEEYIKDHYFLNTQSRMVRNAIAALWWWVYFSYDDGRENPYELTEILFRNYSFRAVWFAVFLRIKNGLMGVLEFLFENQYLFDTPFEMKGRFIANYFNRLGATRELSALPREFFKSECYKIKGIIESVNTESDLYVALGVDKA